MSEDPDDQYCIIEYYLRELFEFQEAELDPMEDLPGLKAHIDDLFIEDADQDEVSRTFIQLYVECTIPISPPDKSLGYFRPEDVNITRGVIIADVLEQTDPPVYSGESIDPETFLEEYPLSPHIKMRVRRIFDHMQEMAFPQENWLAQASSLYNDRLVGEKGIAKSRSIC